MTKEERAAKWDAEFIPCKYHPERRCNRCKFINSRYARCSSCAKKRPNGALLPSKLKGLRRQQKRRKGTELQKACDSRYYYSEKGQTAQAWKMERRLHG